MTLTDEQKRQVALLVGSGLTLAAAYNIVRKLPGKGKFGGITKLGVDYMHNYPEGFYAKGVTPFQQKKLIAKEAAKSVGRMAKSGLFVPETVAYRRTGIAPFVNKMFQDNNNKIEAIKNQYINNQGITYSDAKSQIRNLEKQVHHKLTSDFSNNRVFGSPIKADLRKYAQKYVESSGKDAFKKTAGSKGIADYVASRWIDDGITSHDMKGLKYMKYKNIPFADVLRGAQFDPNMYKGMLSLKGEKDITSAITKINSLGNKFWTPNAVERNGKILFQVSPRWKSNFDWGGYNAVGIWDPKNEKKIRIMATDFRNLFNMKVPNPVLNFVDSKEISIKDATRQIAEVDSGSSETVKKLRKTRSDKGLSRNTLEQRKALAETLRVGGTKNTLLKEQEQVFGRFQKVKSTVRNTILKPNLFNKSGRRHLAKIAPSMLKRLGAAGLPLAAAYALYNKLSEE